MCTVIPDGDTMDCDVENMVVPTDFCVVVPDVDWLMFEDRT